MDAVEHSHGKAVLTTAPLFSSPEVQPSGKRRLATITALVPPKAKEFDST